MSKVEQFFEIAKKVELVKNGKYIDGIPKGKSKDIDSFYRLEDSLGYPQPDDINNYLKLKQR
tara:strand:- start:589 stop:774 length:186 start_codon:yes stop_codon:yes gene_type:complete